MATVREKANGSWEVIIKRKGMLPPAGVSKTFPTEGEAAAWGRTLEQVLDSGTVPAGLNRSAKSTAPRFGVPAHEQSLRDLIRTYKDMNAISDGDERNLGVLIERWGNTQVSAMTVQWCEDTLLADMKRKYALSASTMRHYMGALSRCLGWAERKDRLPQGNPIDKLPRNYVKYSPEDAAALKQNTDGNKKPPRTNGKRWRRLEEGEEAAIMNVISTELHDATASMLVFRLALETAMRMREMCTLTRKQIHLDQRYVHLPKTKRHNSAGESESRNVPLTGTAVKLLKSYLDALDGDRLFGCWWDGSDDKRRLDRLSANVSMRFGRIFDEAGCPDLHFHDLRHEAICRMFEHDDLSDTEIMLIVGHLDHRTLMRYANLRAGHLANKMRR